MSRDIRVVIADESPFVCRLLASYLDRQSGFEVVAAAQTGRQAVETVKKLHPDVVTLGLEMQEMDGLKALRQIMRECPAPVVVITGVSGKSATRTMQALDLGAVDFILKYAPGMNMEPDELRREIIAKVRGASFVRVIRLTPDSPMIAIPGTGDEFTPSRPAPRRGDGDGESAQMPLIIIGASTGGPMALRDLLSELPANFGAPIVIVQHIPASFTGVLATQLNRSCRLQVREAEDGELLRPGCAYIAPGGYHLLVAPEFHAMLLRGRTDMPGHHCPSIDITMESAARIYGSRVKGVLLTGMGTDGVNGLAAIRASQGETFAQDEASCVIFGMPARAIEKNLVDRIGSPVQIAAMLALGMRRPVSEPRDAMVLEPVGGFYEF